MERLGHGKVKASLNMPASEEVGQRGRTVPAGKVTTDHNAIATAFSLRGRAAGFARRMMKGR